MWQCHTLTQAILNKCLFPVQQVAKIMASRVEKKISSFPKERLLQGEKKKFPLGIFLVIRAIHQKKVIF